MSERRDPRSGPSPNSGHYWAGRIRTGAGYLNESERISPPQAVRKSPRLRGRSHFGEAKARENPESRCLPAKDSAQAGSRTNDNLPPEADCVLYLRYRVDKTGTSFSLAAYSLYFKTKDSIVPCEYTIHFELVENM